MTQRSVVLYFKSNQNFVSAHSLSSHLLPIEDPICYDREHRRPPFRTGTELEVQSTTSVANASVPGCFGLDNTWTVCKQWQAAMAWDTTYSTR